MSSEEPGLQNMVVDGHEFQDSERVFLRLVHKMPSRFKVARAVGGASLGRLQDSDMAVSLHLNHSEQIDVALVGADGACLDGNRVCILRNIESVPYNKIQGMMQWDVQAQCYSLHSQPHDSSLPAFTQEHDFVVSLLHAKATPNAAVVPHEYSEQDAMVTGFLDRGLVQHALTEDGAPGLQLSAEGVESVTILLRLSNSKPLLEIRHGVPLAELTLHELMQSSLQEGWQWNMLPKKKRDRCKLVYTAGADKLAYFSRTSMPHKLYVVCLLRSGELCERGQHIPHYVDAPAKVRASALHCLCSDKVSLLPFC